MLKAILGVYIILGILSLFCGRDQLLKDLEVRGSFIQIRTYQIIVTLGFIIIWPCRLASLAEKRPEGISILLEVSEAFQEVAKERRERIDGETMGFIISKFILMNQQFGSHLCREHLKYELEKYRREGLREDYIEGGASSNIGQ